MGLFKYIDTLSKFNTLRVSTVPDDSAYRIGDGIEVVGDPEILWKDICFISDKQLIWNHGIFYADMSSLENDINNLDIKTNTAMSNAKNAMDRIVEINKLLSENLIDGSTGLSRVEILENTIENINIEAGSGESSVKQKNVENNSASGDRSFSVNKGLASGKLSFAANNRGNAQGDHSSAFGNESIAKGINSFACGNETIAYANHSFSQGYNTLAIGSASHAEGINTVAGNGTIKNVDNNTTAGFYAHAEGNGTFASGNSSHAEGKGTQATQYTSHAEGLGTIANGVTSHAEGYGSEASGSAAHTEGIGTKAINDAEHAEGSYNVTNSGGTLDTETRHSVGIGTSNDERKNAFEIMHNGDAYLYGVGDYDGTNATVSTSKSLQEVLNYQNILSSILQLNITASNGVTKPLQEWIDTISYITITQE